VSEADAYDQHNPKIRLDGWDLSASCFYKAYHYCSSKAIATK